MQHFWEGFEKRAVSLTGMMGGLRSGSKAFSAPGVIAKPAALKSGISVAPRTVPSALPTPTKVNAAQNMAAKPTGVSAPQVKVPKPAQQKSLGVAATNI